MPDNWYFLICLVPIGIVILVMLLKRPCLNEFERGVVFTLGKFSGIRNPGLTLLIPGIQRCALLTCVL